MSSLRMALRHALRRPVRIIVVAACAAVVAASGIAALVVSQGAAASIGSSADQLGADILVAPLHSSAKIHNTLLLGLPTDSTIAAALGGQISSIVGVRSVSPQLYMTSLAGSPCCPEDVVPIVAFDPGTDFALRPWLGGFPISSLGTDEIVGGSTIQTPEGSDTVLVYGRPFKLRARLARTGTSLDHSIYMTFEAARSLAASSVTDAASPLVFADGQVSAFLVRVDDDANPSEVAQAIDATVEGVDAFAGDSLLRGLRTQAALVERVLTAALAAVALMGLVLLTVAASVASRDRGSLGTGARLATGPTRARLLAAAVLEGATVSGIGAAVGVIAGTGLVQLYQDYLGSSVGLRLGLPTTGAFAGYASAIVLGAIIVTALVYIVPSRTADDRDPLRDASGTAGPDADGSAL